MSSPTPTPTATATPTPTSSQRRVERRRRQKERQRTERERLSEQAVEWLEATLEEIPPGEEFDEWRSHVHTAITRIRKSARRTPDRDLDAVKAAMRKPLVQTAEDIALEAQLPRKDVEKLLSAMVATGAATMRQRQCAPRVRGPKVWLYFLIEGGSRSDDVLP